MLSFDRVRLQQGAFALEADLSVRGPGVVAVVGPSGGGKSTLLAGVAGFLEPVRGAIRWQGQDLAPLAPGKRPVSILFQDQNLFPHLTVRENMGLGISPRLRLSPEDERRIREVLVRVGLDGMAGRMPGDLSGGQASRAALARVLLQDRPVVLLDEPFAALGPALRREMLDLVADTLGDRLVLMVTHDPDEAARVADRTILVAEGCATGPFETGPLLADPPEVLALYLGRT